MGAVRFATNPLRILRRVEHSRVAARNDLREMLALRLPERNAATRKRRARSAGGEGGKLVGGPWKKGHVEAGDVVRCRTCHRKKPAVRRCQKQCRPCRDAQFRRWRESKKPWKFYGI